MRKAWWKEAVIYQIYPRSFCDSDGDGVGDLRGILQKLDYLRALGVDTLWLSPIYESPNHDNGYDISDYRRIHPDFGTMDDFHELLGGAHRRGMRLLMDLVVNHTSDEHPWFKAARRSKDHPLRHYYIWRREPPNQWTSIFGGPAWERDEATGEYYLHLFSKHQPDLNWENPDLRHEIYDMMRFWLDKGIDGFRMDVIPMISKRLPPRSPTSSAPHHPPKPHIPTTSPTDFKTLLEEGYCNGPRVHEFLQEMNREVLSHYDIATIGEGVGIPPEKANLYVGADRGELNMIFHFGHMLIDNGPGGKFDIIDIDPQEFKDIFIRWDRAIGHSGWLNIYLDNHDFPRLVSRFGDDSHPRSHNASAKLLAMLLLTLRGTPCLYQGTEIGMTNVAFPSFDDYRDVEVKNQVEIWRREGRDLDALLQAVHHQARDNTRTPFQWSRAPHAGFTTGTPWIAVNPNYLTRDINAAAAQAHEDSIFHFYRKLLTLRRLHPTLIYGDLHPIDTPSMPPTLFVYLRTPPHPQSRGERLNQPAPLSNSYLIVLNRGPSPTPPLDTPDSQELDDALDAPHLRLLLSNAPPPTSPQSPLAPWECRLFLRNLR